MSKITIQNPDTCFMFYVICGETENVISMINKGTNVNVKNEDGFTPLMMAIDESNDIMANILMPHSDVNIQAKNGETALTRAVQKNKKQIVRDLIKKGSNVNHTYKKSKSPLIQAIILENLEMVDILISTGADVNLQTENGTTALIESVISSNKCMFDHLVNAGAIKSVNYQTTNGQTMLMLATIYHVSQTMFEYLLMSGADTNIQDNTGHTALMYAIMCGRLNHARCLLLSPLCDSSIRNVEGKNAYMIFMDFRWDYRWNGIQDHLRWSYLMPVFPESIMNIFLPNLCT